MSRSTVTCSHCRQAVRWISNGERTVYAAHTLWCCPWQCEPVDAPCCGSGKPVNPSQLPGWHPHHVCGMFCDGQDGGGSQCYREREAGPPSAVDQLGNLVR